MALLFSLKCVFLLINGIVCFARLSGIFQCASFVAVNCKTGKMVDERKVSDCVDIQDGGRLCTTGTSRQCDDTTSRAVHYTREELLSLKDYSKSIPSVASQIKSELLAFGDKTILPRKRGKKGGVLARLRKRYSRPPFPSVILSNVKSLQNKVDELKVLCRFDNAFRETCLMAFSETWLNVRCTRQQDQH